MHGRVVFAGFVVMASPLALASAHAAVLWTDNAESGAGQVTTNVSAYSLIQSEIVGQGSSAFHLANPGFQDNWFAMNSSVTLAADSKLFFQSRMGFVASGQVAKVEMSTNGGASWPTTVYSQTGTSNGSAPMEGGFSLRTIDLAPYIGQSARFRFYLDYVPGGSAFTQTDADVGWIVDDIQIADSFQKSVYSIGNPSNEEQLYLEYINRARADALVEANRLASENAPGVQSAYTFFGVTGANIINQFTASVANGYLDRHAQPLSFNSALLQASELHSQDLLLNNAQGHVSYGSVAPFSAGFGPMQRAQAFGYSGGVGENVYSYNNNVAEGHAGFDVDWGNVANPGDPNYNPAFAGQGMQNPAGHRRNIHNADFKEVGVGLIAGTGSGPNPVGPYLVTQNFGNPGEATFITGVVYEDLNANNFYDVGEGRSGVRVDVDGSAYYAVSTASGGYSVPVSGNGAYNVMFTGGGFASYATTATVAGGLNVKVDYLAVAAPSFAADFNNDGRVDQEDLVQWRGDFGIDAGSDADDDGDTDGADFLVWQRQVGSGTSIAAVPEPATGLIAAALVGCLPRRGRLRRPAVV